MRKVEVDIEDLISIIYAGSDGELYDYLKDFLKKDLHVTRKEIREYGKILGNTKGYDKEDTLAVNDFASSW